MIIFMIVEYAEDKFQNKLQIILTIVLYGLVLLTYTIKSAFNCFIRDMT
jgi:hypothetical protein